MSSSIRLKNLDTVGCDASASFSSTDLNTGSLVLNAFSKSVSIPSLLMNSLIRSKPASDERSPPSKFILICLLLSKAKVFTILIKGSFVWDC